MGRCDCRQCELLKDYYWLKVNRLLLTLKSFSTPHAGPTGDCSSYDQKVRTSKEEALTALSALVKHRKACYAIDRLREVTSRLDRNELLVA